jgi:hypothetical protein
MAEINVTTATAAIVVDITTPPPVAVNVTTTPAPVTVGVVTNPVPVSVDISPPAAIPVLVDFTEARDAYQLAVVDGFTGTRAQWLASLQGPAGPTGAAGPQGLAGAAGVQGPAGAAGAAGAQGPAGAAGATGPAGVAGLTAVVKTAAEYAALTPEQQADTTKWYVIPKTP